MSNVFEQALETAMERTSAWVKAYESMGIFYSYTTPIAVKHEGRYYLTLDKFSKTTSVQQNTLLRELPGNLVSVVPQSQIAEIVKYYAM